MFRALLFVALFVTQGQPANLGEIVWNAVRPALPFPAATPDNTPVDGSAAARWIVRRASADEGPLVAEILANPLNRDVQARATRDMAAIQQEVFAAERRAQVEFERAREAAKQSASPVAVDGITLDDEGVAGDRADANERVVVEAESASAAHAVRVEAAEIPRLAETPPPGAAWVVVAPAAETRPDGQTSARFYASQALVFFSASKPVISELAPHVFTVRTTPAGSDAIVVTLRGNAELVDDILQRADWSVISKR